MKELDAQALAESYRGEERGVELEVSLRGTGVRFSGHTLFSEGTVNSSRPQ